jgi:hypothetical protein
MKPWHLSIVWGMGFTAVMFAAAAGLFGLSDHLSVPVIPQALFGLAVIAVIAILPGSPLGLLALNMHSAGFLVLTAIGDVVFYTFVAHSVLARRARRQHREAEAKS